MDRLKTRNLWFALAALVALSPLGLLAQGSAWAEWRGEELDGMLGFVPAGLRALEGIWRAPATGYSLPVGGGVGYALSGALGVVAVLGVTWLLGRWLSRNDAEGR